MNPKPLTINTKSTIKEAIELMKTKKIQSLIVKENEDIYSIISYKDIFKLFNQFNSKQEYEINFVGEEILFEDELQLVKGFALKTMNKINKISNYNNLKIEYKVHGDKDSSHIRKGELKINLDAGGKVLSISKDIQSSSTNNEHESKIKAKWNLAKLTQESLKILENKVLDEKNKK